jgi:hypothetical protein
VGTLSWLVPSNLSVVAFSCARARFLRFRFPSLRVVLRSHSFWLSLNHTWVAYTKLKGNRGHKPRAQTQANRPHKTTCKTEVTARRLRTTSLRVHQGVEVIVHVNLCASQGVMQSGRHASLICATVCINHIAFFIVTVFIVLVRI